MLILAWYWRNKGTTNTYLCNLTKRLVCVQNYLLVSIPLVLGPCGFPHLTYLFRRAGRIITCLVLGRRPQWTAVNLLMEAPFCTTSGACGFTLKRVPLSVIFPAAWQVSSLLFSAFGWHPVRTSDEAWWKGFRTDCAKGVPLKVKYSVE